MCYQHTCCELQSTLRLQTLLHVLKLSKLTLGVPMCLPCADFDLVDRAQIRMLRNFLAEAQQAKGFPFLQNILLLFGCKQRLYSHSKRFV